MFHIPIFVNRHLTPTPHTHFAHKLNEIESAPIETASAVAKQVGDAVSGTADTIEKNANEAKKKVEEAGNAVPETAEKNANEAAKQANEAGLNVDGQK